MIASWPKGFIATKKRRHKVAQRNGRLCSGFSKSQLFADPFEFEYVIFNDHLFEALNVQGKAGGVHFTIVSYPGKFLQRPGVKFYCRTFYDVVQVVLVVELIFELKCELSSF